MFQNVSVKVPTRINEEISSAKHDEKPNEEKIKVSFEATFSQLISIPDFKYTGLILIDTPKSVFRKSHIQNLVHLFTLEFSRKIFTKIISPNAP